MLAPCEADCLRNHDQTVERLAERGGLDPWELMAVVQGKRWREVAQVPMPDVVEWLKAASGEETDISVLRQQLATVTAERDQLRAMLEECLPGKTADGYDGGLYELALSAECERRDHEPGSERFFASKVRDIHARARALLAATDKGAK